MPFNPSLFEETTMGTDELNQRTIKAAVLRHEADCDEALARRRFVDNPTYSGYLQKRAEWKRKLANDEDGGYGQ